MTINLHSRIAVAAVIAPLAVLAVACGDDSDPKADDAASDPTTAASSEPTVAPTTSEPTISESATPTEPADTGVDYVVDGVWHQADGDTVQLPDNPQAYDAAVIWNDQLVATRWDGEVFSVADVIDEDGNVVDSFDTTANVVVNAEGTTLAWIDTDGTVMTAWDGGEVSIGTVDLAAPGETIAWFPAAVTGGPDCHEVVDGCIVYANGGEGTVASFDSHGVNDSPLEQHIAVRDVDGGRATVLTKVTDFDTCSALIETDTGTTVKKTCDVQLRQISPDGASIAAPPTYFDGLGPTDISIVDSTTLEETGRYAPEGGFVADWAWSTNGNLLVSTYDGANWHLMSLSPTGEIAEIADPVKGNDVDSPFTLIQH